MAAQDNREPSCMVELLGSKRKIGRTKPAKFLGKLGSNWSKERRQEEAEAAQQAGAVEAAQQAGAAQQAKEAEAAQQAEDTAAE